MVKRHKMPRATERLRDD